MFLGRGYSGHEHLKEFGLVNMNARLYDPALGRFLAPDPFVQMPDLSQNFNRYSYAMNNPLRYVDEDGEFIHIIIGAVIGGTANLIYKAVSGQLHSFKDGFAAFGIGAAAGGLGGCDWWVGLCRCWRCRRGNRRLFGWSRRRFGEYGGDDACPKCG